MSTDLDLRRTLLGIVRRPASKLQISNPRPSTSMADGGGVVDQKERSSSDDGAEDQCCRTPTSVENKIPALLQCPPAPRKRKRPPTCRRRLMELEFVEIVSREEIEPYLASSFEHEDRVKSAKRSFCSIEMAKANSGCYVKFR
ncbi:cyclin-dependent protein kinase inhibitor SMR1-like [Momordica charantia]|uniref:Cyclin-dependent protein kinase inhibitor SMR1-like n=1 Tax=Momordica charantia TaxID=3673 RepID=A0A6J1CC62_MOMCH|nr:cyclin-dependent protein kinase inhibitor SMR1-like [Momordica charantia]